MDLLKVELDREKKENAACRGELKTYETNLSNLREHIEAINQISIHQASTKKRLQSALAFILKCDGISQAHQIANIALATYSA